AAVGTSNSEASTTPRPPASFSRITAVGLLSPRSISEIIERLTPLLAASASSEKPRARRSSRTRSAMRPLRSAVSVMLESKVQYTGYHVAAPTVTGRESVPSARRWRERAVRRHPAARPHEHRPADDGAMILGAGPQHDGSSRREDGARDDRVRPRAERSGAAA